MGRSLRVFVPSAAGLLTDHRPHGEGLTAWRLLSGLAARGHELEVCTRDADLLGAAPFELRELGASTRFESLDSLAYAVRVSRVFARLGGRGRFDLVHWLYPVGARTCLYRPPRGVPYVVGPVAAPGLWSQQRPFRAGDLVRVAAAPLLAALERRAWDGATAVLAETRGAMDAVPQRVRHRAHVLNPGVDTARFHACEPPVARRIVFIGRLERAKGVRELVEAFAAVRRGLPDAELVLAGDGPERAWIEARRQALGLNGELRLLGSVRHDDVPPLLEGASLLCAPSYREPLGNSVLEAMAAGRAVVAGDAGGPRDLVDTRGGRLVPPRDTDALALALTELLSRPDLLAEMGRFNRELAVRELSLEHALDELEALYAKVTA